MLMATTSAARGRRTVPGAVRHRPQLQSNVLAEYIQKSLDSLVIEGKQQSSTKTRRRRRKGHKPPLSEREDARSWAIQVTGAAEPDELEDSDEYEEILADLAGEYTVFGSPQSVELDRQRGQLVVTYTSERHATAAIATKHGQLYGGKQLQVCFIEKSSATTVVMPPKEQEPPSREVQTYQPPRRKRHTKLKNSVIKTKEAAHHRVSMDGVSSSTRLVVRNMVDAAEVKDEDEFAEIVDEMTETLRQHGAFASVQVYRGVDGSTDHHIRDMELVAGDVIVEYESADAAGAAFVTLNGKRYGGRTVECHRSCTEQYEVKVSGIVDPDELEDDDEFAELVVDLTAFFSKSTMCVDGMVVSRSTGDVVLTFSKLHDASSAACYLAGKSYGGKPLVVLFSSPAPAQATKAIQTRSTDVDAASVKLTQLMIEFLQRLGGFQERAHIQNPLHDKRSRRLVLGLREVKRGLQLHKIRLLLVATDLDESDLVHGTLTDIIAAAAQDEVPLVRTLTRRKLGRVLKKQARVSCVGVYSVDGALDLFHEIVDEHRRIQRRVQYHTPQVA